MMEILLSTLIIVLIDVKIIKENSRKSCPNKKFLSSPCFVLFIVFFFFFFFLLFFQDYDIEILKKMFIALK